MLVKTHQKLTFAWSSQHLSQTYRPAQELLCAHHYRYFVEMGSNATIGELSEILLGTIRNRLVLNILHVTTFVPLLHCCWQKYHSSLSTVFLSAKVFAVSFQAL